MNEPAEERSGFPGIIVLLLAILVVLIAVVWPSFADENRASPERACLSNLRQLSVSVAIYAGDFDYHIPPAAWMDPLYHYAKDWDKFSCRVLSKGKPMALKKPAISGYALNYNMEGRNLSKMNPACVMFFEFDALGPDIVAGANARSARHNGGSNVSFADTSAKFVKAATTLREKP